MFRHACDIEGTKEKKWSREGRPQRLSRVISTDDVTCVRGWLLIRGEIFFFLWNGVARVKDGLMRSLSLRRMM